MTRYYGKYRGKVENNLDDQQIGRIQVSVPGVFGDSTLSWAMPCAPYAGNGVGLFAIPPVGSNVWVEFEGGNPDYPIWSGCFWSRGQTPVPPGLAQTKVFKTETGTITIDDTPGAGGIKIKTTAGMKIEITSSGIELNNGQGASITLTGNQVSVNQGALDVT